MPAITIRHIRVRRGRLDVETATALAYLHVSEQVAQRVLELLPSIGAHVCVNGAGQCFADELCGTELAHLLEHVVIELQGRAYRTGAGDGPHFIGHTSWLLELAQTRDEGIALMRTSVTFADDLVALQALQQAAVIVEWAATGTGEPPCVAHIVEQLHRRIGSTTAAS